MELPWTNKLTNSFTKCFLPYGNIQNQPAFCSCFSPSFFFVLSLFKTFEAAIHASLKGHDFWKVDIAIQEHNVLWRKSIYQYSTLYKGLLTWPKLAIWILPELQRMIQVPQVWLGYHLSLNHKHTFMSRYLTWTEIGWLHLLWLYGNT